MSRFSSIPKPRGGVKAVAAKKPRVASPSRVVAIAGRATTLYPVQPTRATTVNKAGGPAHRMSTRLEVASLLAGSLMSGKNEDANFYESEAQRIKRLTDLIDLDPEFAAKAILWARHEAGLRSVSHIGASQVAAKVKGASWTRAFFENVVKRPDDMCEIAAAYRELQKSNYIPNAMKDGLRAAFGKFDEYSMAKYQMKEKDPSLVDLMNLLHPRPTTHNRTALQKLRHGKLVNTETWEAELSAAGQSGGETTKAGAWKKLLVEGKLLPLGLLRNIRNIIADCDADTLDLLIEQLTDEQKIRKSLILPFQYVNAYEAVEGSGSRWTAKTLAALDRAAFTACGNITPLKGRLCVLLDDSGSMNTTANGAPAKHGALFAAILLKIHPQADFIMYNSTARYVQVDTSKGVMQLNREIFAQLVRGGTSLNNAIKLLNRRYDNLVILSDEETWQAGRAPNHELTAYRQQYTANPTVYGFNLAGAGTLQFPENQVVSIAGFSFRVFDLLNTLQRGLSSFVDEIDKIDIATTYRWVPKKKQ